MFKLVVFLGFIIASVSRSAYADPCVKVRDGKDGYECMKFDAAEKEKALQYGLRLGSPYEAVKQKLTMNGWRVAREWLKEEDAFYSRNGWLVCGHGQDAICWTVFEKGKNKVSAVFSGTNDGHPLISVDTEP